MCDKDKSYKICSNCSSLGHTYGDCTSSTKKCINCNGPHHAMSPICPRRKEIIRSKTVVGVYSVGNSTQQILNGKSFSVMVSDTRVPIPVCANTVAKSISCVILASLKNIENPGTFATKLNSLLKLNSMPILNLEGFVPTTLPGLERSRKSQEELQSSVTELEPLATTPKDESAFFASPVGCQEASSSKSPKKSGAQWMDKKVYKVKGTVIKSTNDFNAAYERGDIIITSISGNVCDYTSIVNLIEKTKVMPQMNELKKSNFNSLANSLGRFLRSKFRK